HGAGQYNAVLNFETAPKDAGPLRDRLKQLGTMVRLEIDRVSQAQGGTLPKDGKIERGDTQFFISIYNLANVAPRETVTMRIAAQDVPSVYQALREAVGKAKGRVTNANINEQDKNNITAQLEFDIRRAEEAAILQALKKAGDTLTRLVTRVPESENVTDAKIHFKVEVADAESIPARETVTQRIAVENVATVYESLRDVVSNAKGRVVNANINEQDRQNVTAQLEFDVRRTEEAALLIALKDAGETLIRQVTRQPEGVHVSDAKVRFRLDLVPADSIPARETVRLRIAAENVPVVYQALREAVGKTKGRIVNAQINEQDRQNVTAQLEFNVRRGDEEAAIQKALKEAGETLIRQVTRLPEGINVTDAKLHFQIELATFDSIPARETVTLRVAAEDVASAYNALRDDLGKLKGRVINAQLNEQDRQNVSASLEFYVARADEAALQAKLSATTDVLSRQVYRHPESAAVTDSKIAFKMELVQASTIPPREIVTLAIEVSDVERTLDGLNGLAKDAKGRVVDTQVGLERNGRVTARVIYDLPLVVGNSLVEKFKRNGQVRVHQVARNPQAPEGKLALARIIVTLSNTELLVPADQGLWPQVRHGLSFSLRGLTFSLSYLIIGLLFVLPWLLLIYAILWFVRRVWRNRIATADGAAPSGTAAG
ncbi:MAG: hypothetical protein L0Y70_07225, partial [Gemmataceae bacterium]|nr:hypothetical protein [Gemmataceae bacterium]